MSTTSRPVRIPVRRRLAGALLVLAVTAAACGGSDDGDAVATTTTADDTPTSTAGAPPAEAEARTMLDGWVSYALPTGWEVVTEAEGLLPLRDDLGEAPPTPSVDGLETLLEIRHPDDARVLLTREPAFLDAADIDAWTAALADDLTGGSAEPVSDETIDLAHGPGRRLVYETSGGTVALATTAFADQRVALLIEAPADLDEVVVAELDALVSSITLDPAIVLTPLLQFHAGLIRHDVAGGGALEVGIHVPSDWQAEDVSDGVRYTSADGTATAEVTFAPVTAVSADDTMSALLDERGRDDLLDGTDRDLGGAMFRVARFGPADLDDGDLGTSWLLLAETPVALVTVRLDDTDATTEPDLLLLRRIIDTLTVRTA